MPPFGSVRTSGCAAVAHDEAGLIPLHQQSLIWGVSKKVKIVQRADNQILFYWARMD